VSISLFFLPQHGTGTAEGYAEQLKKEAKKYGFAARVVDLDDFDESEFMESRLALCVMATYGEGEPTDNASKFFKWLKNLDGPVALEGLSFTVFGLGNKQYEHFNKV